jgi:predicted nucleotidyltransferase
MARAGGAESSASGRFLLRISPGQHALLRKDAAELGISLNDYCCLKLAAPVGSMLSLRPAAEAVRRAAEFFGERLIGMAAFGSWTRGEAADGSDIDILIVLEEEVRLTRQLYREWDRRLLRWGGRDVEPHFVHLPPPDVTTAGLWAEVALDGVVLFERGLRLSARLVRVRQDICSGRVVRKIVHGHPYWAEVV